MRYIAFYLFVIAVIALTVAATTGAFARDVTCTFGTYGAELRGC